MFSFGQINYALHWDIKFPDTLYPIKMASDSVSCNTFDQSVRFIQKGDIAITDAGWFLCLENRINDKNEFLPLHFSDMGQIDKLKCELKDVTNDKIPELILTFQSGYTEYHYESGGGGYHEFLVVVDTSKLNILFSAITKYNYELTEVHYKDEEINGVNALTKFVEISREESKFELEYVIRFKNDAIELVCMKYTNTGNAYKLFELLNPGIMKYKWVKDKWIKE